MSGRRRGGHGGHANHERWLLTYADLITLLLVFFVVLYSMSQSDYKKRYDLQRSLTSAFHVTSGAAKDVLPPADPSVLIGGNAVLPETAAMIEIQERLEQKLAEKGQGKGQNGEQQVTTAITQRGLVVSLANSAFFDPGSARLKPEAMGLLTTISSVLSSAGRPVLVEGHTDDIPIATAQFPSNWELSTARATTVVRWMVERHYLPPSRLSASGYGEYHPVVPNTSPANRAKNRRVDVVVLRSEASGQRPSAPRR